MFGNSKGEIEAMVLSVYALQILSLFSKNPTVTEDGMYQSA
jgi:hypothetical protein